MLKKSSSGKSYVLAHRYYGLLQLDNDSALWPPGDNLMQVQPTSAWEIYKDIDKTQSLLAAK